MSRVEEQKQHTEAYRKLALRRQLLERGLQAGPCYVPFIGDGDIALELYQQYQIYGADIDPKRVATAKERFPHADIRQADCDSFPFKDVDRYWVMADFDAYAYPYAAFRSFWESTKRTSPFVAFFTDGERQAIFRVGSYHHPEGDMRPVADLKEKRQLGNFYYARIILPWFENYIKPWTIAHTVKYLRGQMLYWGAVLVKDPGARADEWEQAPAQATEATPKKRSKKARFIDEIARGHSVKYAASVAGVGRERPYKWAKKDPKFSRRWEQALEAGADVYEDFLFEAASTGNVTAIIVGLKMRKRFMERQEVNVLGSPQWKEVKSLIVQVLQPHPEALQSLLTELGSEDE